MQNGQHQAQGLQRLFSTEAAPRLVSVLATPNGPDTSEFVTALAETLVKQERQTWVVDSGAGNLSARLGCRPLLSFKQNRTLDSQVVRTGSFGLLNAVSCMAGDISIAEAAKSCRNCDFIIFDGGRFTLTEAPLEPSTKQHVIVLLGRNDAEAAYALIKAIKETNSPARLLLLGEGTARLAQVINKYLKADIPALNLDTSLYQISNKPKETSSNTLTIVPNLGWVVSRITENDQPKVAHGGIGNSAKEVEQ